MEKPQVSYNTFYHSWHEAMRELEGRQYGRIAKALNEYCFYGIEPNDLEGVEKTIFIMARANIDASTTNKLNGQKGGTNARGKSGAPKGNHNASKKKLT